MTKYIAPRLYESFFPESLTWVAEILFPKRLERLDEYFLVNHPRLWATKFWYIFYWALLVNGGVLVVTSGFMLIAPVETWISSFDSFSTGFWVFVSLIFFIELLMFAGWVLWLRQYSPEREHAPLNIQEEMVALIACTACLLIFLGPSAIVVSSVRQAIGNRINDAQILQDATYLDTIYATLADKITNQQGPDTTGDLPVEEPQVDIATIRKYTALRFDENARPFDWSALGKSITDAQKNLTSLRTFIGKQNHLYIAAILGFFTVGFLVFLIHYAVSDTYSLLSLGFFIFIGGMILETPISAMFRMNDISMLIISAFTWFATMLVGMRVLAVSETSSKDIVVFVFALLFPCFVFCSVAFLLILVFRDPKYEGLIALIAMLSNTPFLPFLKRKLLAVLASAQFLESGIESLFS